MDRGRLRLLVASLVLALVVVVVVVGVVLARTTRHDDAEARGGPLRVAPGGRFATAAPGATPYDAGFGAMLLCADPSHPVTIDRVTLSAVGPAPRRVGYWIRSGREVPVASALGSPPAFSASYGSKGLRGTFRPLRAGTRVTRACGSVSRPVPRGEELVVSMRVGPAGARIGAVRIHYTSGGRRYVRVAGHDLVACGSSPSLRGACR